MAASLEVHDRIMRSEIAARGGYVFSTAGDAFAAAFATIGDAVAAALEIQRRLLAAAWPGPAVRVRMGIHTGEAEERDGDYFGPAVNRAARIM
nr:adenylate/guanylate cyclase domain-containing protein [Gemmatimonadota bacterium]NIR35210.1 adenylate/guanylate cyclase domain-containing protein [Actinomycetota bacterium]NIU72885.1 adenylate/guanylate cyclase domain-containing protein [Gammaproteobacteria bacterium]NIT65699.1 adenylate/guanylate cyclase domain-containing protein [Gemmatimonadota bacterium]NIW74169.1 adenylate/guanylate cyclase domain-containing protein [Gemmatimonadota bacterium]